MVFLMLISLYTSRQILAELGVDDYGIYNVVSGFIVMLSFVNGAISSSTSRYITFALGKNDRDWLGKVFSTCFQSHVAISLVILIIAESFGLWMVTKILVIPENRMYAAIWVYQCSIISTILMIWSVPYNACIIAHEKMSAFAYISVFEGVAKLIIVFALDWTKSDRLILYAVLLLAVQILISSLYWTYSLRNFEEAKPKLIFEKELFKETLMFTGWNLWGGLAVAMYTQGLNILLNVFFGPLVNAARGVAVTVQSTVSNFSSNFQTALNPQITKCYASGNLLEMYKLVFRSSKFAFLLMLCIVLPIICNTDFIMNLWLKEVPTYTPAFVRIMLIICLIDSMANPIMTAINANGNIKYYQIIVGAIQLSIIVFAYIALLCGGNPISVFVIQLLVFILAFYVRLRIAEKLTGLSISGYLNKVVFRCCLIAFIAFAIGLTTCKLLPDSLTFNIISLSFSFIATLCISYTGGLNANEKLFINEKIRIVYNRISKSNI